MVKRKLTSSPLLAQKTDKSGRKQQKTTHFHPISGKPHHQPRRLVVTYEVGGGRLVVVKPNLLFLEKKGGWNGDRGINGKFG